MLSVSEGDLFVSKLFLPFLNLNWVKFQVEGQQTESKDHGWY